MGSFNCARAFVRVGARLHLAVADCQGGNGDGVGCVGDSIARKLSSFPALFCVTTVKLN